MNRPFRAQLALLAAVTVSITAASAQDDEPPRGLITKTDRAADGYTLFTPLRGTDTHLIDMDGEIVHTWPSEWKPGQSVYLLPNGNLLRCCQAENDVFSGGGEGGRVVEIDWEGNLRWEYVCSDEKRRQHHDCEPLPNGNVLMIAWEIKSHDRTLRHGRDPELLEEGHFWPDYVMEVKPTLPKGGEIVWEWHTWDHLIQDRDPDLPNYGVVSERPERVDINADAFANRGPSGGDGGKMTPEEEKRLRELGYVGDKKPEERPGGRGRDDRRRRRGGRSDWMHTNGMSYNAELDQIALSIHSLGEIWIIDHGTTTEQAKGPAGDLLYRWGNPAAWSAGPVEARRLFGQHDVRWLKTEKGWNLTVFNNGRRRPDGDYSSIDELALPWVGGRYVRDAGEPFGPETPTWSYTAPNKPDFFSSFISGAERQPNGNTVICSGEKGRVFEVTEDGDIVWEWWCPIAGESGGGSGRARYGLFRASRVAKDHPALAGRRLAPRRSF